MVRSDATADDSLAAIFERSKFGMAIAAIIRIMATTISNSIREKPRCFLIASPAENASYIPSCRQLLIGAARKVPTEEPSGLSGLGSFPLPGGRIRTKKGRKLNFLPFVRKTSLELVADKS